MRRLLPHSRRARIGLAAVVVLIAAAVSAYIYARDRTGNIYHPHARFVPELVPLLPVRGPDRFAWPFYGYSKDHTRFFPVPPRLRPPFNQLWAHNAGTLLEFPPVMYGDHIFQLGDNGTLNAINKHNGHIFWTRHIGSLSAASPAVVGHTVYATVLGRGQGSSPGVSMACDPSLCLIAMVKATPTVSPESPAGEERRITCPSRPPGGIGTLICFPPGRVIIRLMPLSASIWLIASTA